MRALLMALALSMTAAASFAQVVSYMHEGEAAFSLEYPPGWEVRTPLDAERPLISALPRDGSMLWHGVWILRDATSIEAAAEQLRNLEDRLFSDVEMPLDPWTETYGDLSIRCMAGRGFYKGDQRVGFFLGVFELPGAKVGAFVYMGDPDAIATHAKEMEAMMASLEVGG